MAIILNDNIKINAGKPSESRYLSTGNTAYISVAQANLQLPIPIRYTGLTVNILGVEYWYNGGVADINLIEKKYDSIIPSGDFVTGATNIGFFSGFTGVQVLPIDYVLDINYNGLYYSLYNNYYRDINGIITIGTPTDGIPKRGYVKTSSPTKSWIWNEYTGNGNLLGWILVDGNISEEIGTFQNGVTYYPPAIPYIQTSWISGTAPNNLSNVVFDALITGSLTTGSTITIGAPVFKDKNGRILEFRTIITKTPEIIDISYDGAFVYVSGATANAGNGLTKSGTTINLGGTLTTPTTIVRGVGNTAGIEYFADYHSGFTDRSLVDKAYVDSKNFISGERITKQITQISHGFNTNNVIGWSGGTYNKAIANGLYDGEVLGIVSKCINSNTFELTQAGYVTGLTGLITNTTYFLSDVTAGLLTPTEPIIDGHISRSILIADSNTSAWVLPYAGVMITSGSSVSGPLIRSVCIPTTSYQVKNTDFFIGANNSISINLPLAPPIGMVVVVADICNTASAGFPITITGSLVNIPASVSYITTASGSLSYIFNGTTWNVFAFTPATY